MNHQKYDRIYMKMESIAWYSAYVDCLMRILNEFIQNGDSNIRPSDLPNLSEIISKLAFRLNRKILDIKADVEFYN